MLRMMQAPFTNAILNTDWNEIRKQDLHSAIPC
jgi:hypothetical protein